MTSQPLVDEIEKKIHPLWDQLKQESYEMGSIFLGESNNTDSMVILRGFHYKNAVFGLGNIMTAVKDGFNMFQRSVLTTFNFFPTIG